LNQFREYISVSLTVSERKVDVRSSELESVELFFGKLASEDPLTRKRRKDQIGGIE
jgi:hypothetical protein